MNQVTQAVILAAGLGTRLKHLTQHTPKALMPVAGEAAIGRVIRNLVAAGIQDIAINLHHYGQQIEQALGYGSKFNANLHYSYEDSLLNSGGGVRTALDVLPDAERVLVHNADIMMDIDFQILDNICPHHGCALALVANPQHNPLGDFSLDNENLVSLHQPSHTFSGVSVWDKQVFMAYPSHQNFTLIEPIHKLIAKKQCLGTVHHGYWFDIGRPRDLIRAHRFYKHEGL